MNTHSIGKTIAALRKQKGWTQAELADKLSISDKAVSKWENDRSEPSAEILCRLSTLFGVTIDYLLTGAKEPEKTPENIPPIPEESIRADDARITSAIHNGILNIDEVLDTKNYKLIEIALEAYPICEFELNYNKIQDARKLLSAVNWRDLFRFAVDVDSSELIKSVLDRNVELCEKSLDTLCRTLSYKYERYLPGSNYDGVNAKYLRLKESPNKSFRRSSPYEDIIKFILSCKQQTLDDCNAERKSFESELEKGNTDIVIIRLCKKLEEILHDVYQCEGDLLDMLKEYCSKHGGEGGASEEPFVKYLHKLRKYRNRIAHHGKSEEDVSMSIDEIKFCIEYIFRMG